MMLFLNTNIRTISSAGQL